MTIDRAFARFAAARGARLLWTAGRAGPEPAIPAEQGIYLQLRSDGSLYVGQSVDAARRQAEHGRRRVEALALAFAAMPGADYRAVLRAETRFINDAAAAGFRLANRAKLREARRWAARRAEQLALSECFDPVAIEDWLNARHRWDGTLCGRTRRLRLSAPEDTALYLEFRRQPGAAEATHLVNLFVSQCVVGGERWRDFLWRVELCSARPDDEPWIRVRCGRRDALWLAAAAGPTEGTGPRLRLRLRLARRPLIYAWGDLDRARARFPDTLWVIGERPRAGLDRYLARAARSAGDAAGLERACLSASRWWSQSADHDWVGVECDAMAFEGLMLCEPVVLAAQLQGLHDMRRVEELEEGRDNWPW